MHSREEVVRECGSTGLVILADARFGYENVTRSQTYLIIIVKALASVGRSCWHGDRFESRDALSSLYICIFM